MRGDFRITSHKDMVELVERWGFVPLFRNEIRGFSIEEHTPGELWFSDEKDGPWEWKGPTIRESGCAYGKFFKGKAVFISRDWFLDFANFRRDGYDFDARYNDGLAAYRDKTLYDVLEQNGSLLSKQLKNLWTDDKETRKSFDSIMTRLQMMGYVTTADFEYMQDKNGKPYGWGVARYATPEHLFGEDFTSRVYQREPQESAERIAEHLCTLFPAADTKTIFKLIGDTRK